MPRGIRWLLLSPIGLLALVAAGCSVRFSTGTAAAPPPLVVQPHSAAQDRQALVGTWSFVKPGEDPGIFDSDKASYVFRADGTGGMATIPITWRIDGVKGLFLRNVGPENPDPQHPYYRGDIAYRYTLAGDNLTLVSSEGYDNPVPLYRRR